MLWRVRTTLPDRPGALASLAGHCAEAGVDIRGVQVFPGSDAVTDELVLETPDGWREPRLVELVEQSGWAFVAALPCSAEALADQPTRYVQAARRVLASPSSFPEVVGRLFDAEADPAAPTREPLDVIEMAVGDVDVQVRRRAPFTEVERLRARAMADLVSDVLARDHAAGWGAQRHAARDVEPRLVVAPPVVSAVVEGALVGLATLEDARPGDDARAVTLRVDPAWRRRGVGTRLLVDVARLARTLDVPEIVVSSRADNHAVLPMVLAAGLRGRIRMSGDRLTVRIGVGEMKPLDL